MEIATNLLCILVGIFIFVANITNEPLGETILATVGLYLTAQTFYFACRRK